MVEAWLIFHLVSTIVPHRIPAHKLMTSEACPAALAVIRSNFHELHDAIESISCEMDFSAYSASRPILKTKLFGRVGGSTFDDVKCNPIVGIKRIKVHYGTYINSIQVIYLLANESLYHSPSHGTSNGTMSYFELATDEHIMQVEGKSNGNFVTQLKFISKSASGITQIHGPYGTDEGERFSINGYILGLKGYAGAHLYNVAIYYLPPIVKSNQTAGGSGGHLFDDKVDAAIPPVVGIKNITIHYGNYYPNSELIIHSIYSTFYQLGGSLLYGNTHGIPKDNHVVSAELGIEEKILQVEGSIRLENNKLFICQITFSTSDKDNFKKYGPFGCSNMNSFQFNGTILGFYGRSGGVIDRLGVYVVQGENI